MPEALQQLTWVQWVEPDVLISLLPFAAAYLWVIRPEGRRHFRGSAPVPAGQQAAFLIGLAFVYVGFGGPLDVLADGYLFTAHMTQHALLTMASAPLLLIGTPSWLVEPLLDWRPTRGILTFLTRPIIGSAFFAIMLCLSIWPPFYDYTQANATAHFLEHAFYLIAALALWWPVWSQTDRLPRLQPLKRILYLFLNTLPMITPLLLVIFQTHPIYPYYDHTPRLFGLTQLGDQQLGANVMAVIMHISLIGSFVVTFIQWARVERALEPHPRPQLRVVPPLHPDASAARRS